MAAAPAVAPAARRAVNANLGTLGLLGARLSVLGHEREDAMVVVMPNCTVRKVIWQTSQFYSGPSKQTAYKPFQKF